MTDAEKGALIQQGREVAESWLSEAISVSKTPDAMNAEIYMLEAAAIHLLAVAVYNTEAAYGVPAKAALKDILGAIDQEVKFLRSSDMVALNPGDGGLTH